MTLVPEHIKKLVVGQLQQEPNISFIATSAFSNKLDDEFSANSRDITSKGITCLAQVKASVSCSDCTLCWASKKPIGFITH